MEKKLLHLYDDVMNLYGEYANVAVLARYLRDLGFQVQVETLSLYETKDISGYDFYYMGSGTERKQKLALTQLMQYREALAAACDAGKTMLFTGNSFELLGRTVTDAAGNSYEALGLADFTTVESKRRITGDCIMSFDGFPEPLVGFINKCSRTCGVKTPLFQTQMGFGNEAERGAEGFRKNNCLGTHLTGPMLVKNPAMLRYVAGLLGAEHPERVHYDFMEKGYETTVSELTKRMETMK